jgi:hypothetical protein
MNSVSNSMKSALLIMELMKIFGISPEWITVATQVTRLVICYHNKVNHCGY